MEHELDKHSSYMQQVMLSDLLAEMVENVSEEVCAGWSCQHEHSTCIQQAKRPLSDLSHALSLSPFPLSLCCCASTQVWLDHYTTKSNDEIVASMAEEALMPVMVEVAAECRLEGVAALVAVAKEDIDKKQKKADRLNKMKKESGDKEKFASKKFEATKKEVRRVDTAHASTKNRSPRTANRSPLHAYPPHFPTRRSLMRPHSTSPTSRASRTRLPTLRERRRVRRRRSRSRRPSRRRSPRSRSVRRGSRPRRRSIKR